MKWLVVMFCIMISAGLAAIVQGAGYTISMAGEGTTTVPADAALISVSVESNNENVTQAQDEVQTEMDQLMDVLKRAGVKEAVYCQANPAGFQASSPAVMSAK